MTNQCACGEREECDHSCMPDVIDGVCSHCGERVPGLPILPAGMTNEQFYKEQAEYWRQIASQNHPLGVAQAPSVIQIELDSCRAAVAAIEANRTFSTTQNHNYSFYQGKVAGLEFALAAQPPAAPVEPLVSALQHLNDLGERALLYAQSMPAAPVETAFQSMEDAILFVLKDMRACGSWDAKTMDRVVENVEQIFRSPFLPPLRSSADSARLPANVEIPDEALTAAMRAFEGMSTVLRYREKDKWHACDKIGMMEAIRAALPYFIEIKR